MTFNDIADHLVEFPELFPDDAEAIHRFGSFLAHIEDEDHDHPDGAGAAG